MRWGINLVLSREVPLIHPFPAAYSYDTQFLYLCGISSVTHCRYSVVLDVTAIAVLLPASSLSVAV